MELVEGMTLANYNLQNNYTEDTFKHIFKQVFLYLFIYLFIYLIIINIIIIQL